MLGQVAGQAAQVLGAVGLLAQEQKGVENNGKKES
jgi:hypothetical protein